LNSTDDVQIMLITNKLMATHNSDYSLFLQYSVCLIYVKRILVGLGYAYCIFQKKKGYAYC